MLAIPLVLLALCIMSGLVAGFSSSWMGFAVSAGILLVIAILALTSDVELSTMKLMLGVVCYSGPMVIGMYVTGKRQH